MKWVNAYEASKKKCKVCKKRMNFEHNMFCLSWLCENEKCKAYLLREGAQKYSFTGKIEVDWK